MKLKSNPLAYILIAGAIALGACDLSSNNGDDEACWPDMTFCQQRCFDVIQDSYSVSCSQAARATECRGLDCGNDTGVGAGEWLACGDFCEIDLCLEAVSGCQEQCLAQETENGFEACSVLVETETCEANGNCSDSANLYLLCMDQTCP